MQKKSAAEMVVGWPDSMLASSTLLKNVLRPRDLICCWESYVLMLQKNKKQKNFQKAVPFILKYIYM